MGIFFYNCFSECTQEIENDMEKLSFLSNLIGWNAYHIFKEGYAMIIFWVGTGLLAALTPLTFLCYSEILSYVFSLITGTSLLFIVYVAAVIVLLDKEVKITMKPFVYKLTVVWGMLLVIGGISAIYVTNKYRNYYAIQCKEVYVVNKGDKFYHLYKKCSACEKAQHLYRAKGYQAEKAHLKLCPECVELAEEYAVIALENQRP